MKNTTTEPTTGANPRTFPPDGGSGFTPDTSATAAGDSDGGRNAHPTEKPAPTSALRGHLRLVAEGRSDGTTVIARQSFSAPFHFSKPYWDGHALQVQLVNSTAGILAGDELEVSVEALSGARLSLTTPAAARAYMMNSGAACCRQRFVAGGGACLEYLPEALYPHRDTDYTQHTRLEVGSDSSVFFVDQLAPGRVGLGECWAWRRLRLGLDVVIGGRLVLRELLDQSGSSLSRLAAFHGFSEAWFATALVIRPSLGADSRLWGRVRALASDSVVCGVTHPVPELGVVRLIGRSGLALRDSLVGLRGLVAEELPALRTDHRKL